MTSARLLSADSAQKALSSCWKYWLSLGCCDQSRCTRQLMYSYSSLPFRMFFSCSQPRISSHSSTSAYYSPTCYYSDYQAASLACICFYRWWLVVSIGVGSLGVTFNELLACLSAYSWASFAFSSASACLMRLRSSFSSCFCFSSASFFSFRCCSITAKPCLAAPTICSSLSWFCSSLIFSIFRKSFMSAVILFISSLDLLSSIFSMIFLLLSMIFFQQPQTAAVGSSAAKALKTYTSLRESLRVGSISFLSMSWQMASRNFSDSAMVSITRFLSCSARSFSSALRKCCLTSSASQPPTSQKLRLAPTHTSFAFSSSEARPRIFLRSCRQPSSVGVGCSLLQSWQSWRAHFQMAQVTVLEVSYSLRCSTHWVCSWISPMQSGIFSPSGMLWQQLSSSVSPWGRSASKPASWLCCVRKCSLSRRLQLIASCYSRIVGTPCSSETEYLAGSLISARKFLMSSLDFALSFSILATGKMVTSTSRDDLRTQCCIFSSVAPHFMNQSTQPDKSVSLTPICSVSFSSPERNSLLWGSSLLKHSNSSLSTSSFCRPFQLLRSIFSFVSTRNSFSLSLETNLACTSSSLLSTEGGEPKRCWLQSRVNPSISYRSTRSERMRCLISDTICSMSQVISVWSLLCFTCTRCSTNALQNSPQNASHSALETLSLTCRLRKDRRYLSASALSNCNPKVSTLSACAKQKKLQCLAQDLAVAHFAILFSRLLPYSMFFSRFPDCFCAVAIGSISSRLCVIAPYIFAASLLLAVTQRERL